MVEALLKSLSPDQIVIVIAGLIYILKPVVTWLASWLFHKSDKIDQLTFAIKELTLKLEHLSLRLAVTEQKLDSHEAYKHKVTKLESDVKHAHDKLRDLT